MLNVTERLDHEKLSTQVKQYLLSKFPNCKGIVVEPAFFSNHDFFTHLVLLHSNLSFNGVERVLNSGEFGELFDSVFSGAVKLVLIESEMKDLFMGYSFYSFNAGFLINELLTPLEFSLTPKGLISGDQVITNSWLKVCDILDLSSKTWERGFKDPPELFAFLDTSNFLVHKEATFQNRLTWSNELDRSLWSAYQDWLEGRPRKEASPLEVSTKLQERIRTVFS